MLIAIPLDDNKEIISELMATLWVVVDFDNGLIQSINYYNTMALFTG